MGRTATTWVTSALNCHRSVFFVHGFDFEPRKSGDLHAQSRRIIRDAGKASSFVTHPDHHDRYFDILEALNDHPVIGTVHSLFPAFSTTPARKYQTSTIVRHPIQRIESFRQKKADKHMATWAENNRRYLDDRCVRFAVPADTDAIFFIMCCHSVFYYDAIGIQFARAFRMEDLVSSTEAFAAFFSHVTGLAPESDPAFWVRFNRIAPKEVIASAQQRPAQEIYDGWLPWQRALVAEELYAPQTLDEYRSITMPPFEYETLADIYTARGYDLGFDAGGRSVRPAFCKPVQSGAGEVLAHIDRMALSNPIAAADASLGLLRLLLAPPPSPWLPADQTKALNSNGRVGVASVLSDDRGFEIQHSDYGAAVELLAHQIIWRRTNTDRLIDDILTKPDKHVPLRQALQHFPIQDKQVLISASPTVLGEAMAIAFGAKPYSLPIATRLTDDERLTILSPRQAGHFFGKLDAALCMQLGAMGLGRYGDTLNADGDLASLALTGDLVRSDGVVYLPVTLGADVLVWNVNRHYGAIRLPRLLDGWTIVGYFTETSSLKDEAGEIDLESIYADVSAAPENTKNAVLVLRRLLPAKEAA